MQCFGAQHGPVVTIPKYNSTKGLLRVKMRERQLITKAVILKLPIFNFKSFNTMISSHKGIATRNEG